MLDAVFRIGCLLLIVTPVSFLILNAINKYSGKESRRRSRFEFRSTNRQDTYHRLEDDVELTFSKWIPDTAQIKLQKAGIQSLAEFVLMLLAVVIVGIIAVIVNCIFFPKYWFAAFFYVPILLGSPIVYVYSMVASNQKQLITQIPLICSVIGREFSRTRNMEYAFQRVYEETRGWPKTVFKKMVDYLNAVKGDVNGALEILVKFNESSIIDQLVISMKQGMNTDRIQEGLDSVSRNAILQKKEMQLKESKSNDAFIFSSAVLLVVLLMVQAAYYFLSDFSISGFMSIK